MSIADKLTAVAQNVSKVHEAGKEVGIAEGREAERSEFWDNMLPKSPERTDCSYAFYNWNMYNFKPNKRIIAQLGQYCFAYTYRKKPKSSYYEPFDLAEILESLGVEFITTPCTNAAYMFVNSMVSRIPSLNLTSLGSTCVGMFYGCGYLETIDAIQMGASTNLGSAFTGCTALKNITFKGEIVQNINFGPCPQLTHESLMSIINALYQHTSGTHNLGLGTANLAKLTDEEKAMATQKGWTLV